jgi:hypothetical protein
MKHFAITIQPTSHHNTLPLPTPPCSVATNPAKAQTKQQHKTQKTEKEADTHPIQ